MRRRHVTGLAPGVLLAVPWAVLGGPGLPVTGLVLAGAAVLLYPVAALLSPGFPACLAPRRRRAAWRNRPGSVHPKHFPAWQRRAVLAADRGRCAYRHHHACAGPPHVDHVIPWAWGGLPTIWNLSVLCETANMVKSGYYADADGYEHYRPWPGYNDREMARKILAAERRRQKNPLRYLRAALALR